MTVGERILYFRKKQGLTQLELAGRLGITDKAISKWERNLSCPDISLLSDIAKELNVTVDALLRADEADGEKINEEFVSLEKYLMGDFGYTVPDFHPEREQVTLILDYPYEDDAAHGYALSGKLGAEVNKYLFGKEAPFDLEKLKSGRLGVTYVSNVPLANLNKPINKLIDELEYTRLNRFHLNRLLLEGFIKRFEGLVLSDTVRVIALTREFNQKYFGAFISYSSPKILSVLHRKLSEGRLKILFVGAPLFWNKESYNKPDGLLSFKEYFNN